MNSSTAASAAQALEWLGGLGVQPGDDLAVVELQIEGGLDNLGRHVQELDRHGYQLC